MVQRILVTGVGGLIGSHLYEGLAGAYEVACPGRSELDLLDMEAVRLFIERGQFDQVLHAATWNATAMARRDPSLAFERNLKMFFNLVRCEGAYGRLIHFGSGAEFSREHWHARLTENELGHHVPKDDYGLSKLIIARHSNCLPWALNLRLFGVFGPREDMRIRFISSNACRGLRGEPLCLRQDRRFDYLHVDDVVAAVAQVLERPELSGTFNLCRGEGTLLSDIAAMILESLGLRLPVHIEAPGEDLEYSGSNEAFRTVMQTWSPHSLQDGVFQQVRWLQENQAHRITDSPSPGP